MRRRPQTVETAPNQGVNQAALLDRAKKMGYSDPLRAVQEAIKTLSTGNTKDPDWDVANYLVNNQKPPKRVNANG
jgi:hypothetical protein